MAEPKALPELIAHIDALFARATPGEWDVENCDSHSREAAYASVASADGVLFGSENSEVMQIECEQADPRQAVFWDETGKRNFDLVCALKNNWERIRAELRLTIMQAGATCGSCGFRYAEYQGHIIPCPRCALEKVKLAVPSPEGAQL